MEFLVLDSSIPLEAFITALGVGLLIGIERERQPHSAAGLRTFALVSLMGCLFAMLGEQSGQWLLAVGLVVIVIAMVASNFSSKHEEEFRGFTSEAAVIATYGLGAAIWYGYASLAVMLAISITILLYFKTELRSFSERMTRKDINSMLQFAVLSMVIFPVLPDIDFGPYHALNLKQIWWMVVLISGMALAGYLALRIIGARYGAAVLGIFGGLASSTATTLMFSRHAAKHPHLLGMASIIILMANTTVMLRLGVIAVVVAPMLAKPIMIVFALGILPGLLFAAYGWKKLSEAGEIPLPEVQNPTEIKTALSFAGLYAVVLLLAAWLQDLAGSGGVFAVAFVSGFTDADASVLTSLRMFHLDKLNVNDVITAITLAVGANLIFKMGLAASIGGKALAKKVLPGLAMIGVGLIAGLSMA